MSGLLNKIIINIGTNKNLKDDIKKLSHSDKGILAKKIVRDLDYGYIIKKIYCGALIIVYMQSMSCPFIDFLMEEILDRFEKFPGDASNKIIQYYTRQCSLDEKILEKIDFGDISEDNASEDFLKSPQYILYKKYGAEQRME